MHELHEETDQPKSQKTKKGIEFQELDEELVDKASGSLIQSDTLQEAIQRYLTGYSQGEQERFLVFIEVFLRIQRLSQNNYDLTQPTQEDLD